MNCKPGDLAIVIKADGDGISRVIGEKIVGLIVTVKYLRKPQSQFSDNDFVWHIEKSIEVEIDGNSYTVTGISDDCLRPIRDPGEDAQDETLNWLPSPYKEIA